MRAASGPGAARGLRAGPQDFCRKLPIIHRAREHHRADHPAHRGERLLASRGRRAAGHQRRENLDKVPKALGEGRTDRHRLAHRLGGETGDRAAAPGAVAMARRQIGINQRPERTIARSELAPAGRLLRQHLRARFGGELILRAKLMIEAAMRQAGALHDLGDRDALESLLAEQPTSYLDDPRAIFRRLLPAHFHAFAPSALDRLYDIHHQYSNHDHYHITAEARPRSVQRTGDEQTATVSWSCAFRTDEAFSMAGFDALPLLTTETASVWDVACPGACKHRSDEEYVAATHLVFPYRGVYVHHVGRAETVAEANQAVILNENEPYRVSHPFGGGDACLSIAPSTAILLELAPEHYLLTKDGAGFNRSRLRVDTHTQALAARLRHGLRRDFMNAMEAESLTLALIRRALGERTSHSPGGSYGRQKLVDRAKLVLASDLGRRWTLADIAALVGVSPVYLTQLFRQVEGLPLYRYHLQRRLARALDRLWEGGGLTEVPPRPWVSSL